MTPEWIVFVLGMVAGAAVITAAWAISWARQPEPQPEFRRIEPRDDVTHVTAEGKPRRRARSSEAHMSQPRDWWNGY